MVSQTLKTTAVPEGRVKWRSKYIRWGRFPDGSEQDDKAPAYAYKQDMIDLNFELRIISKPSLCKHPNITQLLAVCFGAPSEKSERLRGFAEPGLIVELAHERFPDLASFFDSNSIRGGLTGCLMRLVHP
ncbi:hypothetical protein FGG08_003947 [Glutinoglossum americanum]|uniref:Uncharacterized protein n=1 Tax=Glutinoglossum americanum TaxID=1670608 RepID=A0A9P8L372_9PEZI|nr:hypothetical protein FGG08_003947 [Glutinoglossum americanum]